MEPVPQNLHYLNTLGEFSLVFGGALTKVMGIVKG